MGVIGVAEIAREYMKSEGSSTNFRGEAIFSSDYRTRIARCRGYAWRRTGRKRQI